MALPKERVQALCVYGIVMLTFLGIIVTAVVATMASERTKPGMHTITVEKPISFIDTTYLPQKEASDKKSQK
jgi:hypothetical protein